MKFINDIDKSTMDTNSVFARRQSVNVFCLGMANDIKRGTSVPGVIKSTSVGVIIRGLDGEWKAVEPDDVIYFRTVGKRMFFDPPNGVRTRDDLPEGRMDIFTVKKDSNDYNEICSKDWAYLFDGLGLSSNISNTLVTFLNKTALKELHGRCISTSIMCCKLLIVTDELYNAGYGMHKSHPKPNKAYYFDSTEPKFIPAEPVELKPGYAIDVIGDDLEYGYVLTPEEIKTRYYIYDKSLNGARFRSLGMDATYAE